ncbi:hypothetical protein [Derxia gummosa]|uniref:Uncharacterized protein n=1 Tax=Derxia gummosa DSM 723 TaxID=1121388 RepID=A0A8B6X0U5_9BURK|nr:hypothetical protein [Derxia gummosa]
MPAKISFQPTVIAASIALASLLSACGGGNGDSASATSTGVASPAAFVSTVIPKEAPAAISEASSGGLATESLAPQATAATSTTGAARASIAAAVSTSKQLVAASDATAVAAASLWVPMKDYDLSVAAGTALDMSNMSNPYNRGMCMNWVLDTMGPLTDATTATAYVNEVRRRGYNLVRIHGIDVALMVKNSTTDANINPVALDGLFRLVAELGKNGIAYTMDAQSYKYGWVNDTSVNAKSRVHYDPRYQAAWKKAVDQIFDKVNPYNGITIGRDPNLKAVIGVNEGSITMVAGLNNNKFDDGLKPGFNTWLLAKYGSLAGLKAAWTNVVLASGEDPALGTVVLPTRVSVRTKREDDFGRYMADTERATAQWMKAYLQTKGVYYKFSNANSCASWSDTIARSEGDVITYNNYHDHPTADDVGGTIVNNSAFDTMAAYLGGSAPLRYQGKYFYGTEFSAPFWNKYRYESGVMMGAFAAHQNWSGLCSFGHQLDVLAYQNPPKWAHYGYIRAFFNWGDPILTANDRLSAFLFRRGDVYGARNTVAYTARTDKMLDYKYGTTWMMGWTPAIRNMSFISRVAMIRPEQTDGNRNWIGTGTAPTQIKEPLLSNDDLSPTPRAALASYPSADASWYEAAARARDSGLISADNITDAPNGIVQSDTNQTIWDFKNRAMRVVTSKSEALTFDTKVRQGDLLSIGNFTPGATVAAISLDDSQTLANTGRILLMHITDAKNTDMKFTDSTNRTLASYGTFPVLIRGSVVEARLAVSGSWTLYALDARGNRTETRPVTVDANGVSFKLDNTIGSKGPSVYYELVRN